MDRLFIVDAMNFLFRSYFAIAPMTNPKGESTNALFGFIRSINKLLKDFSPGHFIAVFDGPDNKRQRTSIYSEYKSNRASMADDLVPQLQKAHEFCEFARIPFLAVEGVEADDTIGSIARWAEKQHAKIYICSSDKDLCQLVSDNVFIINPHKDNLLIDKNKVVELFGVGPEQITDLLGMIGDTSDNIPGLAGFGPKTATTLLQEYGTLENVLDNAQKVKGEKKQEALLKGRAIALMSKKLATIHLDVDFPKDPDFFKLCPPDLEQLKPFYQQMGFMSLLRELEAPPQEAPFPIEIEPEDGKFEYHLVDDKASLDLLIETLSKETLICLDTETTDIAFMKACIVGIGFSIQPKEAWYVPFNGNLGREVAIESLKPLLENPSIGFCGHNIKYDFHVLCNEGIYLRNIAFDTILASYLLAPQNQRHGIDLLCLEKFGKVKIPIENLIGKGKNQISMDQVPIEKVCTYCCEDVDYTCRLKNLFEKELKRRELLDVFLKIEVPLIKVLAHMERKGIYVDLQKLDALSIHLSQQVAKISQHIYGLAGEEFNLNSPKQLSVILFEKMGIKPPKKTATGYSTSADVLESLREKVPIVNDILEYRVLEKLRSTYVDSLPCSVLAKTGRIHCTFNQSVTATGRLSCQDPNLQNIPVRTPIGNQIRSAFKPELPDWSFLSADYSQIELRLLAHLSEDPALITAFNAGEDIHAFTASEVFDVPLKQVTPEMRNQAKAVNFGILYGQQAFGLSQQIGIDFKNASQFIDAYFKRYKRVKEYLDFCKEAVRKTGRAITMTGRQRPIPEINNKNPILRGAAERLAVNTPLQGSAADLIKLAMIEIDNRLLTHKELGKMILQIHDELLFEAPDNQLDNLSAQVKSIMEGVFTLKVPLCVDISIGKNWGEC